MKASLLQSQTELRSFLGLAAYYWRLIKRFSNIAAPLNAQTTPKNDFSWSKTVFASFESLKIALTGPLALTYQSVSNHL